MASKSFPYYPTLSSAPSIDITSSFANVIRVSESVSLSNVTASQDLNVWHAAPNMLTARAGGGGAGTASAGLAFAGFTGNSAFTSNAEKFNLAAWAATTATPDGQLSNGTGTQSAALTVGGTNYWYAEYNRWGGYKFNGLVWSSIDSPWGSAPNGGAALTGTQSAALVANGYYAYWDDSGDNYYNGYMHAAYKYNGTAWSSVVAPVNYDLSQTMSGTQNSAVLLGNVRPTGFPKFATYFNGSVWASLPDRVTGVQDAGSSGVKNALLAFGGNLSNGAFTAAAEKFNGVTWSATSSMLQIRAYIGHQSSGTQNTAHVFGGWINAILANSEAFTGTASVESGVSKQLVSTLTGTSATLLQPRNFFDSASVLSFDTGYAKATASSSVSSSGDAYTDIVSLDLLETVPAKGVGSVWQVGQNMTAARYHIQGTGTFAAPLICNGVTAPTAAAATKTGDRYIAGSWSQVTVSNTDRYNNGAFGTQNSTVIFAGQNTSGGFISSSDYFNGFVVQSLQAFPVAKEAKGTGTYNAGLACYWGPGVGAVTYKFAAGTWTAAAQLPFSFYSAICGNQNAALLGEFNTINFARYNGTTYSALAPSLYASDAYSGTDSYCIAVGGIPNGTAGETQIFNGTVWSAAPRSVAGYFKHAAVRGTPGGALRAGGYNSAVAVPLTEKFLAPVPAGYVRTILSTAPTTITQI